MPTLHPHSRIPSRNHSHALVLDIGTTGIKALVFDSAFAVVARAYRPIKKMTPRRGWVEQDPRELVRASVAVLRAAVKKSRLPANAFRGLAITNQRETTILWDTKTGRPVYPAIGWEDDRTARWCKKFSAHDRRTIRANTGLPVDPYFSASKIRWILDHVPAARDLLAQHRLAFGTVETWIAWNLTGERVHVTDDTNASRTLLFNIRTRTWDADLCDRFGIPMSILPQVQRSQSHFGTVRKNVIGFPLPIRALCGDQQASMVAAGTRIGTTKVTYGTGTFIVQMVGKKFVLARDCYTTLMPGRTTVYAVEAKIEGSSGTVAALRDQPSALRKYYRALAEDVDRAVQKLPRRPRALIVDGGLVRDPTLIEVQSAISGMPVLSQSVTDGTALGAALLIEKNGR